MTSMDPQEYYDELGDGEWQRLEATPVTRIEFAQTIDYLDEHLPDSGRILDAGGGPGRYAIWLAEAGYEVEHVDLSDELVRIAREQVEERDLESSVTCQQGDICDLPFEDDSFDAVCCLGGPLSHVVDADDRAQAMAELRRVATPDAPVFASVIGRLTTLRDIVKHVLDDSHSILSDIAETGDYTADLVNDEGWAECHFFRAAELETELESAGFTIEKIVGLEGIASNMAPELAEADDEAVEDVREVVRTLREDRAVADFSEHILAVCRA
ncbi:class I SAM-dependent methyltransferase [Haladaptatus sp. NG-SE-30]